MTEVRPNVLGDVRAEADRLLADAFVETPDYRALIESNDITVVVGRRGTGKSALAQGLSHHWRQREDVDLLTIAPEEHQALMLRPLATLFGHQFQHIRAGMRVAWRYAFMMEAVRTMRRHYSFSRHPNSGLLISRLATWDSHGQDILDRYRGLLQSTIDRDVTPEQRITDLAHALKLRETADALLAISENIKRDLVVLIDCLDEGYQPDDEGVGIVNGLIQGAIDIKTRPLGIRPVVFLRDNIFRSIQLRDPDYSRNIEGSVLRLHWEEGELYHFVTRRIRVAFDVHQEANERVWNSVTEGELRGRQGFRDVLHMTLHRPRDVLALLNAAFFGASRAGLRGIDLNHVVAAGKRLSASRLNDLISEYEPIFPAVRSLIEIFRGQQAEWDVADISRRVDEVAQQTDDSVVRQDMSLVYPTVVDALFGIGLLGLNVGDRTFSFCHDGRRREASIASGRALVHPCYWLALGCIETDSTELSEVYDEYSIETSRASASVRHRMIDAHVAGLADIEVGEGGAVEFEKWCHVAIRICFAKGLRNVEWQPHTQGSLRPDIIATNVSEGHGWKRVYEDYGCRQVVFEVKNKTELEVSDFRQAASYLGGDRGRIVFIITREDRIELTKKGGDLERVRDIYGQQGNLVVKLTGKYLCRLLGRLKNVSKHDVVNDAVHKILDDYMRFYIRGQDAAVKVPSSKRQESVERRERRRQRKGRSSSGGR